MTVQVEKKKVKIYMWTSGNGIISLTMFKPHPDARRPVLILSEQTVEMDLPVMTSEELEIFYKTTMELKSRASLTAQIERLQAELAAHCEDDD